MARIRTVKPDFFTSLDISKLSMEARLLFIGLWTHADDAGRNLNEPRLIKAAIFPLDDEITAARVSELMVELAERGSIDLYRDATGRALFQVRAWKAHQRIDKPSPSKYASTNDPGTFVESHGNPQGTVLLERKGQDGPDARIVDALTAYTMSVCLDAKNTNQRFRDSVYDNAIAERGPVLRAHLELHPDASVDDLRELLGLARLALREKTVRVEHDPNCEHCAGTGYRSVREGSLDTIACDCTAKLATVHTIERVS